MMKERYEKMRWERIGAFLLAFLLTLGSFSATLVGVLPEFFTAEALDEIAAYYAELDTSLRGDAFRAELAELITETHTTQTTYEGLVSVFKTADADPDNPGNILWFYTGTSVSFSSFGNGGGSTNREHVWPKNGGSAFPEKSEAGSDAHHLRPTEATLNSTRGNLSFGEVEQTTANIVSENGSTTYGATADELCYKSGSFFYPAEGYRGATARILMYVQVRWGDDYNLEFVLGAGSNKTIGDIETLMKWHLEEPPTEEEITRNNVVAELQGNRNPFIDHPEYASKIFCYDGESYNDELLDVVAEYGDYDESGDVSGGGGSTGEITSLAFPLTTLAIKPGDTATLTPTVTPVSSKGELLWWSSDASVLEVDQNGKITAMKDGTATVYVASKSNTSIYASMSVAVRSAVSLTVTGTPSKTSYTAGQSFDPTGLTVKVTYSDGTSETLKNADCQWLDGVLGTVKLASGTDSVSCVYGGISATVSGITVDESTEESVTFDRSSFSASSSYAWQTWTSGDFSGQAYLYGGESSCIQMNSSKTAYYLFNTTPIPGGVTSITIKLHSKTTSATKDFEILTSSTPYNANMGKVPAAGTSQGKKSVTTSGTTWEIDTTDPYFTINYASTGAVYIESVTFTYGVASGSDDAWDASDYAGIIKTENNSSIRLTSDPGLRFATAIDTDLLAALLEDESVASVSYGHLIAPTDLLGSVGLVMDCTHPFLNVENTLNAFYEFDDDPATTHFVGSIIEIKEGNMDREFSARGYMAITLTDDTVIYLYSAVTYAISAADEAQRTINANIYSTTSAEYAVLADFAAYNKG